MKNSLRWFECLQHNYRIKPWIKRITWLKVRHRWWRLSHLRQPNVLAGLSCHQVRFLAQPDVRRRHRVPRGSRGDRFHSGLSLLQFRHWPVLWQWERVLWSTDCVVFLAYFRTRRAALSSSWRWANTSCQSWASPSPRCRSRAQRSCRPSDNRQTGSLLRVALSSVERSVRDRYCSVSDLAG